MASEPDVVRLNHMLEAARKAADFARGRQRADLEHDDMLCFALVHALQIIGEAAAQVSETMRDALPALPWPLNVGMRHRLVHAYFDVDRDIVWDTVCHSVPELITVLEDALHGRPGQSEDSREQ
jgi:uncharacterized protein with HEPN domain